MRQGIGTRNRVWADLSDDEAAAVVGAAAARGCRPSDVVKAALAAFLKAPQAATAALGIEPSMLARLDHVAGRLEAAATKAESHTTATRMALDLAYASEGERKDVREALTDIAMSIGVLAGSIEPAATADNF